MKPHLNFAALAGLLVLLAVAAPFVSAFEISGMHTEEGQKWLNEHWGASITLGELAKIAYTPEDYEKIRENVDPDLLEYGNGLRTNPRGSRSRRPHLHLFRQ